MTDAEEFNGWITPEEKTKMIQELDRSDRDKADEKAFHRLSEPERTAIADAEEADDNWSIAEDFAIEWGSTMGHSNQVSLVVHRGHTKSSLVDKEGTEALESDLVQALDKYGKYKAEEQLKLINQRAE